MDPLWMGTPGGSLHRDLYKKPEFTQIGDPTPLNSPHLEWKKVLGLMPDCCVASRKSLDVSGPPFPPGNGS